MSGDVRTQPSSANSVISTATVQNEDQKNILIQGNNSADVVIQNAMDQGQSTEMGQDGLSQNIIITTEVEGGEQQVGQRSTQEIINWRPEFVLQGYKKIQASCIFAEQASGVVC